MPKFSKKNKVSEKTKDDAMKMARATQKPGQTKEQTKLIAQGIQKGIELYKRQYSEKSRELDKKLNKAVASKTFTGSSSENDAVPVAAKNNKLPWVLLILSWLGFVAYIVFVK